ncbi:MAG: FAD-dependent oxidoreductase, partial [Solirubrobacteraceae bacterium]|nr:FAD-dependent oxidoreductase [Solirubrobacteraceae bacterium]
IADSYTSIGRGRLTAVWGAAALTLFYWTTTPDIAAAIEELGGVELGSAAVWEARIIVAIVAAIWLVRGWRLAAPAAEASGGTPPVPAPLGTLLPMVSPEAGAPGGEERRGELDPDAASERASAQAQLVASAFAAAAPIGQADDGSPDHASPLVASAAPVIAGSPPVQIPDRRGANRADRAPTVVFWPDGAAVPVPANEPTIAATARQVGIQLPEGCGTGLCGCDPVYIVGSAAGLAPAAEQERSTLHRLGLPAHARLACATRVIGDVVVSLEATPSEATPDLTVLRPAGLVVEPPTSPVAAPPPRDIKRVVIVGNGVAGVTAASHLRRLHPECTIDMVSRSPYPFYNRIAITRLIHQPQGLGSLQLMPDHWYETQRVTQWLNTSVASIDRARREVVLGTGQALPYDRLIMATGARWAKPPLPGIDTPGVFGLREAADAIRMRAYAQSRNVRRAAVLGGGLLGLEVAEALAKLGVDVTVVERGDSLAGHVLDPAAGRMLQRSVEAAGVRVRLGASVSEFVGERRLRALRLADGEDIAAELAIICVGIEPLVSVARDAGLEIQRGLVVDEQMRTSDPAILACGDVAEFEGQLGGHWAIGAAQAEVAAVTAFGGTRAFRPSPVPTVLKLDGINVLSVGCVRAGDGVVAVPDENNDDQSYQVTFVRGARPVGVIAINGGPGVDATVDAIVQGNELASAEALPAVRAS